MRQAGRYMEGYREIRKDHGMLEMCKSPEISSAVAAMPVEKFGVDAAILFSDITIPLTAMGVRLRIEEGAGPVIAHPVRVMGDVDEIAPLDIAEVSFTAESVKRTRELLSDAVPVIGFSGAPFTLASYLIEGGGSRNYTAVKSMMYGKQEVWRKLMEKLTAAVVDYLRMQVGAGCRVVQLFDSWAGCLSARDYSEFVLPYTSAIAGSMASENVEVISFLTGNSSLLPLMRCRGVTAVSADWRIRIDEAWDAVGHDIAIQGNLDPAVMLASKDYMLSRAGEILDRTRGRNGHIFNLGHGILKETPEANVKALVDYVHSRGVDE